MATQQEFFIATDSLDPNQYQRILQRSPCHVDTLLAMSHVYMHHGDYTLAAELAEKALFTMERAFHPLFRITHDTLDYHFYENRAFFLALFRHMDLISRKGRSLEPYDMLFLQIHIRRAISPDAHITTPPHCIPTPHDARLLACSS